MIGVKREVYKIGASREEVMSARRVWETRSISSQKGKYSRRHPEFALGRDGNRHLAVPSLVFHHLLHSLMRA